MAKNKRWGKIFIDKRDWKSYNEELTTRYEIYLDFDWVKSWQSELDEMNKGKVGAKYQFPNSMIQYQSLLVEKFSTRGAEAITRKLDSFDLIPKCNDHSTIHRRTLDMKLEFQIPKGIEIHSGADGSGMKQNYSGEYFHDKYGKARRKYVKLVITATKDDILDVTAVLFEKGEMTESEIAMDHIKSIKKEGGNIVKKYDDGAFDNRPYFNFLQENKIESAIRIRSNASTKSKGSMRRKKEVLEFKELGYKEWAIKKKYGMRWPMTEGHFSALKRGYGDCARAKKIKNVLIEHKRKVWIYDRVRKYGRK